MAWHDMAKRTESTSSASRFHVEASASRPADGGILVRRRTKVSRRPSLTSIFLVLSTIGLDPSSPHAAVLFLYLSGEGQRSPVGRAGSRRDYLSGRCHAAWVGVPRSAALRDAMLRCTGAHPNCQHARDLASSARLSSRAALPCLPPRPPTRPLACPPNPPSKPIHYYTTPRIRPRARHGMPLWSSARARLASPRLTMPPARFRPASPRSIPRRRAAASGSGPCARDGRAAAWAGGAARGEHASAKMCGRSRPPRLFRTEHVPCRVSPRFASYRFFSVLALGLVASRRRTGRR